MEGIQAASNLNSIPGRTSSNQSPSGQPKEDFQKVWSKLQAEYGEKPKPQREFKKTLDKDDFLRIMITQMKHQDPTKPFESDKLASEIAQIASIEQLKNVNLALKKLESQNRPLERLAMTNLIGKTVTVDRNRFTHKKGEKTPIEFSIPEKAASVKLALIDPSGEEVFTKDLGELPAGSNLFTWNGKKSNTLMSDSGTYLVKIEAKTADGRSLKTESKVRSKIVGVRFDGDEPTVVLGDANKQFAVSMAEISQIEGAALAQMQNTPVINSANSGSNQPISPVAAASKKPNMISEQAKKIDPDRMKRIQESLLAPEVEKIKEEEAQKAVTLVEQKSKLDPKSRGFPNGMNVYNQVGKKGEQSGH